MEQYSSVIISFLRRRFLPTSFEAVQSNKQTSIRVHSNLMKLTVGSLRLLIHVEITPQDPLPNSIGLPPESRLLPSGSWWRNRSHRRGGHLTEALSSLMSGSSGRSG